MMIIAMARASMHRGIGHFAANQLIGVLKAGAKSNARCTCSSHQRAAMTVSHQHRHATVTPNNADPFPPLAA